MLRYSSRQTVKKSVSQIEGSLVAESIEVSSTCYAAGEDESESRKTRCTDKISFDWEMHEKVKRKRVTFSRCSMDTAEGKRKRHHSLGRALALQIVPNRTLSDNSSVDIIADYRYLDFNFLLIYFVLINQRRVLPGSNTLSWFLL